MLPIMETFRAEFLHIYDNFEKAIVKGLRGVWFLFPCSSFLFGEPQVPTLRHGGGQPAQGVRGVCAVAGDAQDASGLTSKVMGCTLVARS